jgi:hypothetical protein
MKEKIEIYSIQTEDMKLETKAERRFVSFLSYCLLRNHLYPVEIWSKFLQQKLLGVNYKRVLDELQDKKILEIHPSYSNALHFCKKYSFTRKFRESLKHGKIKWGTLSITHPVQTHWEEALSPNDRYLKRIVGFYKEHVQVLPSFMELFSILSCGDKMFSSGFLKERERTRSIKVSRGRCGRIYHPLICMPRPMRSHMTIKGEKLRVYDIHLCHPTFMQILTGDDRESYVQEWLQEDCYSKFGPRDEVKIEYEKAISNLEAAAQPGSIKHQIRNSLYQYKDLRDNLECLQHKGITLQSLFQKLEADLIIKTLEDNPGLELLPMHDGVVGRDSNNADLQEFIALCKEKARDKYDMKLEFRST